MALNDRLWPNQMKKARWKVYGLKGPSFALDVHQEMTSLRHPMLFGERKTTTCD
jgi:hypothetical protein